MSWPKIKLYDSNFRLIRVKDQKIISLLKQNFVQHYFKRRVEFH